MKDILRLRIMMPCAASCLAAYFHWRPEPLTTVVYWNLFYASLNLPQIARLLTGRFIAPRRRAARSEATGR